MEDTVSIVTPDHVMLDFELAGVGSRLFALIWDGLLIIAVLISIVIIGIVAGMAGAIATESEQPTAWVIALLVLFVFLVMWGYFLVFEALWKGQTPGKRWARIRVVRDDGLPIGWREAALRNFVLAADILPPPACAVGGLMIMFTKRAKRLGDLLAGTMVVREDLGVDPAQRASRWGASMVVRVESGRSRRGIALADMNVDAQQLQLIEQFLTRRHSLPAAQRQDIAWRIASPFLRAMGEDPDVLSRRGNRSETAERILEEIMKRADATPEKLIETATSEDAADLKRRQWREFDHKIAAFQKAGPRGLRRLRPDELTGVLVDYRRLVCDLARARSMGQDSAVVRRLNNIAVRAHNVLYGDVHQDDSASRIPWIARFPLAVRSHMSAVLLAAALMFGPAVITYVAVQIHPELGYDLVPDAFLDFEPARKDTLHEFPSLTRPIAASGIMTNNIQVTLLAFGFGLTAGVGTTFLLIFNGVNLGAVAGWMTARGNARALWGWIMPHGGTELMAIMLAGAAGFMLAKAIIAPGEVRRSVALGKVATQALIIELGVMAMLVVAGLIEGFVSPSSIGFSARIAVLAVTLVFWLGYLSFSGRRLGKH
jgi:uncharacterized membrane protein SpoIIM required for sporulation/uncharacterized RDD family membrane protein YckC